MTDFVFSVIPYAMYAVFSYWSIFMQQTMID